VKPRFKAEGDSFFTCYSMSYSVSISANVDITTRFRREVATTCRLPMMTGALGSTFVAAKYWDSFAVSALKSCAAW
jgi:hypothetical protein